MTLCPAPCRLAFLVLVLSACAPDVPDDRFGESIVEEGAGEESEASDGGEALGDIEFCDAADYRGLIGSNIAAVTLPDDPTIRAFGENDIVTQDYRPNRTNIVYREKDGRIFRVYCG